MWSEEFERRRQPAPNAPQTHYAPPKADRLVTWHDRRPRTPSSELVPIHPKRRHGAIGSDDHARRDQLKLDAPVKQDGPVDGHVEPLSNRQRRVGSEAQTGAAHVDSATGPDFSQGECMIGHCGPLPVFRRLTIRAGAVSSAR
jgi:hypothetical protein